MSLTFKFKTAHSIISKTLLITGHLGQRYCFQGGLQLGTLGSEGAQAPGVHPNLRSMVPRGVPGSLPRFPPPSPHLTQPSCPHSQQWAASRPTGPFPEHGDPRLPLLLLPALSGGFAGKG